MARQESDYLDKILDVELGVKVATGPQLQVVVPPSIDMMPGYLAHLTEDEAEAVELTAQMSELKQEVINKLRQNRPASLSLDDPAAVALVMSLGPGALGRVAVWNQDRSATQMFASTTPETSLDRGSLQFTWIGLQNPAGKWEVPTQLDPLRPQEVSGNDLLTYFSGSHQLGMVGNHAQNSPIRVEDPRHLINQFMKLEQPNIGSHAADDLETKGRRRLLKVTSAQKIVAPGELGNSIFQDPVHTTRVYGFEEIPLAWVFSPELMNQDKLLAGQGELETIRANRPDGLQRLQRMGFASLLHRGLGERLPVVLPKNGVV